MNTIKELYQELDPLREAIINHPLYEDIQSKEALQIFMQHHVFAVWDFMSLLKELQRRFTSVDKIWRSKGNPKLMRLINEIVLAEESDLLESGEMISHFDLYKRAMIEVDAWDSVSWFFYETRTDAGLQATLRKIDPAIADFIRQTFQVIDYGTDSELAAYFLFGRESLIPEFFVEIVSKLEDQDMVPETLIEYLKRHIEIDGDEHGPLATEMFQVLCGDKEENWFMALEVAKKALESRIKLWDSAHDKVKSLTSSIQS